MQEMLEMQVWSLGREDPLEKDMATHSSILAWKIPWKEKPGGLVHGVAKSRTWLSNRAFFIFKSLPQLYLAWKWSLSPVQLFATPWTVAYQVPPSMGFSRQEYWSGLPFPSPVFNISKEIKHPFFFRSCQPLSPTAIVEFCFTYWWQILFLPEAPILVHSWNFYWINV